jgi:hypothetical protein
VHLAIHTHTHTNKCKHTDTLSLRDCTNIFKESLWNILLKVQLYMHTYVVMNLWVYARMCVYILHLSLNNTLWKNFYATFIPTLHTPLLLYGCSIFFFFNCFYIYSYVYTLFGPTHPHVPLFYSAPIFSHHTPLSILSFSP